MIIFITYFKYTSTNIFICGDFNINFLNLFNPFTNNFNHILEQLGLKSQITIPSRISSSSSSLIDNVLTNCSNKIEFSGIINSDISDRFI